MGWISVRVVNPIHADAAYIKRETTTARKIRPETFLAKTVMPQHSQCIERLRTAADYTSDMVRCRQCAGSGKRDAERRIG